MDIKELSEKLDMPVEDYSMLVGIFIETSKKEIAQLRSQLMDMDADNAARSAHSVKGAAVNLGLEDMFSLAQGIELHVENQQWDLAQYSSVLLEQSLQHLEKMFMEEDGHK